MCVFCRVSLTQLKNIHHLDCSPLCLPSEPCSPLCPLLSRGPFIFPLLTYSLKLVFSLVHTAIPSSTGYFIIAIVALFCFPHFRLTNKVLAQTPQDTDIANKSIAAWNNPDPGTPPMFRKNTNTHVLRSGYSHSQFGVNFRLYLGIYFLPVSSDLFGQL